MSFASAVANIAAIPVDPATTTTASAGPSSRRHSPSGARWRRRLRGALLALGVATALGSAGCASVEPKLYAEETPVLDLATYFNGTVDAWGVFTDRSGKVVKRFTVVMRCHWTTVDGVITGVLDEDFTYSDGTRQKRVWTLRKTGADRYIGSAEDVVGEAVGSTSGNAFNWKYTLALPVDGRIWHVQFDDWMFLMDEQVMLNRAVMSKFGIRLGEVTLSFRKRSGA